jgi:uncharacterized membrane protein YsdA (DUF1294 family)
MDDWKFLLTPWGILAVWCFVLSVVTLIVFGFDKGKAKWKEKHPDTRRVPEKTLFLLAILGGSPGALLGMKLFHHKTNHKSFRFGIPLVLVLQILATAGMWVFFHTNW